MQASDFEPLASTASRAASPYTIFEGGLKTFKNNLRKKLFSLLDIFRLKVVVWARSTKT